jgi:hypothetical protein
MSKPREWPNKFWNKLRTLGVKLTSQPARDRTAWLSYGVVALVSWGLFSVTHYQGPLLVIVVIAVSVVLAIATVMVIRAAVGNWRLAVLLPLLLVVASTLLCAFAEMYYNLGYSDHLSHGDAIYIAIGTFSTAGFSLVQPTGSGYKILQTIQMGLDSIFVLIAVAAVVARLVDTKREAAPLTRSPCGACCESREFAP